MFWDTLYLFSGLKTIHNGSDKIESSLKKLELEEHNKHCNSDTEVNQNLIEKASHTDAEISKDSLELYFNNFFRDKYFSKLALCEKNSSSRSLKLRKKKSEYHSSKSHSQTSLYDSTLNLKRSTDNFQYQRQDKERIDISEDGSFSDNIFKEHEGNLKLSMNLLYYFTKMFCEQWVKHKLVKEKENVANVKNISSSADMLQDEAFQKLFRNIKQKILEGWYVFYFYFLFIIMYTLTAIYNE